MTPGDLGSRVAVRIVAAALFVLATPLLGARISMGAQAVPPRPTPGSGPAPAAKTPPQARKAEERPRLVVQVGHVSEVSALQVFAEGRLAATATAQEVLLWDVASGRQMKSFPGNSPLAVSSDGRRLVAGLNQETGKAVPLATIWDLPSGREVGHIALPSDDLHPTSLLSLALSADGARVLAGTMKVTMAADRPKIIKTEGAAILFDAQSGREVRRFPCPVVATHAVNRPTSFISGEDKTYAALSPDGTQVLGGCGDGTARLWDAATGAETKRFEGHTSPILAVGFSSDGKRVVTATMGKYMTMSADGERAFKGGPAAARIFDRATGQELRLIDEPTGGIQFESVELSPDGRWLLTATSQAVRIWDASTGAEVRSLGREREPLAPAAFSPDGRFVLAGGGHESRGARLWDASTGAMVQTFARRADGLETISLSADGRYLLTAGKAACLWDLASGRQVRRLQVESTSRPPGLSSAVLSADGRVALSGWTDGKTRAFETNTGRQIYAAETGVRSPDAMAFGASSLALSLDGKSAVAGEQRGAYLLDATTGRETRRLQGGGDLLQDLTGAGVHSVALSPDGRNALIAGEGGFARLWDVEGGREVRRFEHTGLLAGMRPHTVMAVAFSPDGRLAATSATDETVRLWEVSSGRPMARLTGHSVNIPALSFAPDGKELASGGWFDGTVRLWDVATGREKRKLAFDQVRSVGYTADGRFVVAAGGDGTTRFWKRSTGEEVATLVSFADGRWVVVDALGRFDTGTLEEVEGLHWVSPDDPLQPLPLEIFMRDYYEPRLLPRLLAGETPRPVRSLTALNRARPEVKIADVQTAGPGEVSVTVEVARGNGEIHPGGRSVRQESGAYDLRLFRDGQLVASAPAAGGEIPLENGQARLTFPHIRIPRRREGRDVEFSAYAFNVDRIKSRTDRRTLKAKAEDKAPPGRAYVVAMGVNVNENPAWNLRFAANDARKVLESLRARLAQTRGYEEIVTVPLLSEEGSADSATKAHLKAAIDLLAGRSVEPDLLKTLPQAAAIRPARPEDLVVIYFAGHGYADAGGAFYLIPRDTGPGGPTLKLANVLRRAVSSDELSAWLREVDAGDLNLIVDACQSAAAVEGKEFKPGPMGSRGLGQLAYDKGMRILAATQADNVALEDEQIGHGLLTYALTHDGLDRGEADFKPKDNRIVMAEWLEYSAERVPQLYEELKGGQLRRLDVKPIAAGTAPPPPPDATTQRPALFDFSRARGAVVTGAEPGAKEGPKGKGKDEKKDKKKDKGR